ncbi:NPCBM/NEW2 domain-containing protein [Microbacteriaceae bacterium VKM Ac-2855]|nr:NPCBM/NEW2 domain-containing protein [Microbacteriaceae bacterium VKM Ac-2855]
MTSLRMIAGVVGGALLFAGLPATAASAATAAPSPTAVVAAATGPAGRAALDFNRGWKFVRQNIPEAKAKEFDDSGWVDVALPHSFDAPFEVGGDAGGEKFTVGVGWYRKSFDVSSDWAGKRLELDFEGSFQVTDIWVNGQHVTTHRGGFSGFAVDISAYVSTGANEIAISVDNGWRPDLAPRAGDHQFTGGIYRDVTLSVTNPVHVAWYGTAVTTPALTNPDWDTSDPAYYRNIDLASYPSQAQLQSNLDAKRSNVRVQTEVENEGATSAEVSAVHSVKNAAGTVLATFESDRRTVAAGATATIDASSGTLTDTTAMLKDLRLWSPADPTLYTVTTSVVVGDQVVDSYESSFGFRSAQFKKDAFYLNGVKTLLFGANAHQDQAGWGNAVSNSGFRRDVQMIREAGLNLIRGSHYPHDPAYAQAADELGVMYWSEGVFWGMGGQAGKDGSAINRPSDWLRDAYPQNPADEANFEKSTQDALEAMIRVNRNHPSIINWSMGNEVFFTDDDTQDKAKALVSKLRDISHRLDPTRKAGMGGVQRNGFDQLSVSDIAGYNGDGGDIENTTMPNIVAEYGSYTSDRPGSYDPHYDYVASPNDSQTFQLEKNSAGLTLWAGFDHGSVGGAGLARMGMIDYSRIPKDQWYWYRANKARWTGLTTVADPVPVARESSTAGTATAMTLSPSKYSGATITDDGRTDTQLEVTLRNAAGTWVSDTRPVTLSVTSGPGVLPGGKTYAFVPGTNLFDGKAAIAFRSYFAGTSTITASSPGLPDATFQVTTTDVVGAAGETEPANFANASLWGAQETVIAAPTPYGDVNKALSRPLTATSEQAGNGRARAADGNPSTAWTAAVEGPGQSISSFLEVSQYVYKVRLDFVGSALPFTLEAQAADKSWTTVARYTSATVASRPLEESLNGLYAESIRVSFPDLSAQQRASLAELQVFGLDAAQSPQYSADGVYVSDMLDYTNNVTTGYGSKVKDRSADGKPISVGGTSYAKGVGLHADSAAVVDLSGKFTRLAGVAGIDDEVSGSDALFEIYADDRLIFSRELSDTDVAPFDLSVDGVQELRLITEPNGSDSKDHTDWADLRLFGAIRDISGSGAALNTTVAGMSDQLRAGDDFRASVTVSNPTTTARKVTAGIGIYEADGTLLELRKQNLDLAGGATATTDIVTPVSRSITGQYATVSVWDAENLERLSTVARISADPDRLTSFPAESIQWQQKIDGENSGLQKTGMWSNYPTSAAYAGTETFTDVAGSELSWTFSGEYVRIGAKFDGSQSGFEVYIDGTKQTTVSTRVADGSNSYRVAWSSSALSAGQHTVRLVSTGKAGIDYLESGSNPAVAATPAPPYRALLQVVAGVLKVIESGTVSQAQPAARTALGDEFDSAYSIYRAPGSTASDYAASATRLQAALDRLKSATLALQTTVAPRCISGKAYLATTVTNADTKPATVSITTAYGNKAGVIIQPGKSVSTSFNSRSASIPAGSVTFTGVADGLEPYSATVAYPAIACTK